MDDMLYKLCVHNLDIMDGWHPCPATHIAYMLDISVGKVRYHLRKLKKQGLVESFHEGGMTEYGEVYCLWGWRITEKAYETEEYKKAYEFERKLRIECFGWDCGMKEGGENEAKRD